MLTILMMISHMLSDFIFQTTNMVKEKSDMKMAAYIKHGLVLGGTSLPILIFIKLNSFLTVGSKIITIILIHLVLDYIKEKLGNKQSGSRNVRYLNLMLFVGDQLLHILTILIVTNGVVLNFNPINDYVIKLVFVNGGISYLNLKIIFIIGYLGFSGAYLIPLLFDIIYENIDDYGKILNRKLKDGLEESEHVFIDEVKTGKWIGILERILILAFLYTNQLASIGYIIAMKSLARFKMMDNKIFSEYYLLGTFISVVYAFIGFAFFNAIL